MQVNIINFAPCRFFYEECAEKCLYYLIKGRVKTEGDTYEKIVCPWRSICFGARSLWR